MATKKKLIFQRPIGLPEPYYQQAFGAAYLGDSLDLMRELGPQSVNLILTSPPFALTRKKEYGNASADEKLVPFRAETLDIASSVQVRSPARGFGASG